MVWYIPPLSPVADIVHAAGYDDADPDQVFADHRRAARSRSSTWPTCSPPASPSPVRRVLRKLAAVRTIMRAGQLGLAVPERAGRNGGASLDDLDDLYRLLAIAKYDDRYVIPPAHAEDAGAADGPARAAVLQPGQPTAGPGWAAPSPWPRTAVPSDGDGRTPPGPVLRQGDVMTAGTVQARLGAAAVPDRRAVRWPGRTRRVRRAARRRSPAAAPFGQFLAWLRATPPAEVAQHYVETFDLRRRCALYLTYYRYGDTRKRGMAMIAFKAAYRDAGFVPSGQRAAGLSADGAGLRRPVPARGAAAARAPGRSGAAAPRPGQSRDAVRRSSWPPSARSCPSSAAARSGRC